MSKKINLPKRLTLKQARDFCLRQWRWIIKQIIGVTPKGSTRNC